jgi:hypothetical protein
MRTMAPAITLSSAGRYGFPVRDFNFYSHLL